jgi:flagellar M-ring protein FliF
MANELANVQSLTFLQNVGRSAVARQMLMLVSIAATVAIGVAVALWSQSPTYQPLFSGLTDKDSGQVVDSLVKANIPHKVDQASGAVLVPASQIHDVRIKLAAQGLPKGKGDGYELLQDQGKFGASQLLENARYQRALEGELARSIATLNNVQSARVHLALPKQSAFARNKQPASASVLVNLYPGRILEEGQVAAVVHLVASGAPNLDASRVTIVDQNGRLLTRNGNESTQTLNDTQIEYTRKLESSYVKRIEDLLTPIAGFNAVRAQVAADLDFSVTEQTQEKFNPGQPFVRSEQTAQEQSSGGAGVGGIPGALSNQPPGAAFAPETTAASKAPVGTKPEAASNQVAASQTSVSSSSRATRNFELDKTISHTRLLPGAVRRLSVAVVLDDRQRSNGKDVTRTPFKAEEMERLTALVKDAVGFNATRGDTVNVMNIAFTPPGQIEPIPDPPFWKEPWLWDVAKQLGAALLVLFLVFGLLRPMMRGLLAQREEPATTSESEPERDDYAKAYKEQNDQHENAVAAPLSPALLEAVNFDTQLNAAKELVSHDRTRAVQVVKTWVGNGA